MSIVKSLTSIRNSNSSRYTIRFLSHTNIIFSPHSLFSSAHYPPSRTQSVHPFLPLFSRVAWPRSRFVFPLSGWHPLSGPLLLIRPAWKLSNLATPLYFRGRWVIFPGDLPSSDGLGRSSDVVFLDGKGWKNCAATERNGDDERWLNLPNLISISRMISGPVICWMIMNEWYFYSFIGLAISGATDWLDGFIARKMSINSVLGSYLDPLADKILIGCVAVAMVKKDLLNSGLVGILVLRDVALVGGAIYTRATNLGWEWRSWSHFANLDDAHMERMKPLLISKVNTVFQLLLVAAALLQPELGNEDSKLCITYLSWIVAGTTTSSFAAYIKLYLHRRALA